jgi:hypothetical protein
MARLACRQRVWTIFVVDTALIAGDDARLNNFPARSDVDPNQVAQEDIRIWLVESRGGPINHSDAD